MLVLHDLSKSICLTYLIVGLDPLPGQVVELDGPVEKVLFGCLFSHTSSQLDLRDELVQRNLECGVRSLVL
jgi:hypothetical protein